jgi:FHA domain-containing protein
MDPTVLAIWVVRLLFLGLLYLFLWSVVRVLVRDLRAAAREPATELGRLVVLDSPSGEPPTGSAFRLDAVTTLGRDVNNAIVLEDDFVSTQHAALTYRGRAWYLEDFDSTNGTFVNGSQVSGLVAVSFGDELQLGKVRLRLERPRVERPRG